MPPSQLLAGPVLVISLLTLLGYLYGVRGLYAVPSFATTALHTALSLSILAAAVFFARPERGPMAIVSSNTAGGIAGRRLLPALIFIPIAWGWVRVEGQRAGLYGTQFGVAFLVIGNVVALFALGLWSVRVTIREETTRSRFQQQAAERDANLHSAERFRDLVQLAPVGINVLRDGKVVFANPAMCRHESLYQSKDLGRIDMQEYVGKLLSTLQRAYGDARVRFVAAVDRIFLPVDVAVPCGLIANELLTYALKHAFADGSDATSNAVRVEMRQVGENLTFSVADNGRGFPGEVDPTRDETMGLSLVRDLSGQLRGRVEFVADGGARCTVTFPTPDRSTEVPP